MVSRMSRFGPPRISDPDSWEGRMARDHAYPFTLAKWQHQRWIEAGVLRQPSENWGTPTWFTDDMPGGYDNDEEVDWDQLHGTFISDDFEVVDFTDEPDSDGSPWRRSDPPPDQPDNPFAGSAHFINGTAYFINGVDITEFVQAISLNTMDAAEAMNQVARAVNEAQEEMWESIRVTFHGIGDGPYYVDDNLSSRPLTDEDFQRWDDAINEEPTQRYFEPSEPQSDDVPDLLDRIASGVREWENAKQDEDT